MSSSTSAPSNTEECDQQPPVPNKFGKDFWEALWTKMLLKHCDKLANKKPKDFFLKQLAGISSSPGRALDAGCGHGTESLWLATHGWTVTAVDISKAALEKGKSMACAAGADVENRIDWVEGDLGTWAPTSGYYDLVVCLYVHIAGSVKETILRMANGVAPGGTLLLSGCLPIDPNSVLVSGQVQVSVEDATLALDSKDWDIVVAEEQTLSTGVHATICARRRV